MAKSMRRNHDGAFPARVALERVKGKKPWLRCEGRMASIPIKSDNGVSVHWTNGPANFPTAAKSKIEKAKR
jgi:hypothetical protein